MKRVGWIVALSLSVVGPAIAADMAVKAPPRPVVSPAPTWTGFYVGGHLGGGWANKDWTYAGPFSGGFINGDFGQLNDFGGSARINSFLGGVQAGFNYQTGPFVFGLQGDFSAMNASGTEAPCAHSGILLIPLLDCRSEIKGLASVTGRIGYSFGNALLYGKGGGAWIRDRYAVSHHIQPQIGEFYAATETRFGWTVGTGLEYAFVPNWSAFAEYDYYDFGTRSVLLAVTGNPLITVEVPPTFQIRQSMNVVKAGINYRFGGFTP